MKLELQVLKTENASGRRFTFSRSLRMIFLAYSCGHLDGALSRAPESCQLLGPSSPSCEALGFPPSLEVKAQSRFRETSRKHGTPQSKSQQFGSLCRCLPHYFHLLSQPIKKLASSTKASLDGPGGQHFSAFIMPCHEYSPSTA